MKYIKSPLIENMGHGDTIGITDNGGNLQKRRESEKNSKSEQPTTTLMLTDRRTQTGLRGGL